MPNVKDACPPISDNTSAALLPSTAVPSTFKKSLSATPDVNTAKSPLDMPVEKLCIVCQAEPF